MDNTLIPTEWVICKISEIATVNPKKIEAESDVTSGFVPMSHAPTDYAGRLQFDEKPWGEIKKSYTNFQNGDVIFAKVTPCFENGKAAVVEDLPNGIGAGSSEFYVLRADAPYVSEKLIYALIKTHGFATEGAQNMIGAVGLRRVPRKFVEDYAFPLAPLAEQKVIAEKLDKLLAKVDSIKARLDAVPDTLKRFRQSVLAAAVSGKLTEEWRSKRAFEELTVSISDVREKRKQAWIDEQVKSAVRKGASYKIEQIAKKYKEPTEQTLDEFDLTLIKHIPEEWVSTNLDSVSIAVTGKTPKTTEESYWNGDIPFISPSQITNEGCLTLPERHVTQEGTSKTTILPSGSIMIVCIGTIGKVGLVDKEVAFNQQINALIPTQVVLPEFLFFWSKTLHSWLNKTSSAVVNAAIINKSRLCTAPCPLPSIAEQTEIVRRVEKLFAYADKVEAEVNAAQARVNKLTQSILAKAFRGELTAKWREQNPELISGGNSAEALLEKIKNEREKLKPTKKRKAK
ncbi:type I restriction endonuclease subunit S [Pseudoalteromonas sp. J010]|nr:type I restriction endonuclease subunit S [Pseudoalteromonas sp. J010]